VYEDEYCEHCVLMDENRKLKSAETIWRIGEGDKGEWWRGEINYGMLYEIL
jgi:hypothetical protein